MHASEVLTAIQAVRKYLDSIQRVMPGHSRLLVTDFGRGAFGKIGAVIYTIENREGVSPTEGYSVRNLILAPNQGYPICHRNQPVTFFCEHDQVEVNLSGTVLPGKENWEGRRRYVDCVEDGDFNPVDCGELGYSRVMGPGCSLYLPPGTWYELCALDGYVLIEQVSTSLPPRSSAIETFADSTIVVDPVIVGDDENYWVRWDESHGSIVIDEKSDWESEDDREI